MNLITSTLTVAADLQAKPKPPPQELQDGLDTVTLWVQIIGGGIAVIGLMILAIGMMLANRRGRGEQFMESAGWWLAGCILLGTAGVVAPIFL